MSSGRPSALRRLAPPEAADGPTLLTVSVSLADGSTLVVLDGEADVTACGQLQAALSASARARAPRVVVDLSGLRFIDASCLSVLWEASETAREAGGSLELAAPQPEVTRAMELWGTREAIEKAWPKPETADHLLLRVARGDEAAFADVYDQFSGAVYGLVRRIVADPVRAEQVAVEALTEVWQTASRFSPADCSAVHWIMTVARRRAMGHIGRAAGRHAAGNMLSPAAAPEEDLSAHPGLSSLPAPQREAVVLALSGHSRRQISRLTGVPPGTADERLRDGLLALSGRLE